MDCISIGIDQPRIKSLKEGRIEILNGKLVLYKHILVNHRHVTLIIIPKLLRRSVFSHFRTRTSAGHIGEYKTLYRMWLQLFQPILREDVKKWVNICAHCISYNFWRTMKQELHFSLTFTIQFYIMHIDIWSPEAAMHNNQEVCHPLNYMCDLTQFLVSFITTYTKSEALAKLFMEEFMILFDLVAVVVVDADRWFRGAFEEMCKNFLIKFWPIAHVNNKGNIVKKYQRLLNKK